jgi:hypothetical protein
MLNSSGIEPLGKILSWSLMNIRHLLLFCIDSIHWIVSA